MHKTHFRALLRTSEVRVGGDDVVTSHHKLRRLCAGLDSRQRRVRMGYEGGRSEGTVEIKAKTWNFGGHDRSVLCVATLCLTE